MRLLLAGEPERCRAAPHTASGDDDDVTLYFLLATGAEMTCCGNGSCGTEFCMFPATSARCAKIRRVQTRHTARHDGRRQAIECKEAEWSPWRAAGPREDGKDEHAREALPKGGVRAAGPPHVEAGMWHATMKHCTPRCDGSSFGGVQTRACGAF
ncbi:hypothetical protein BU16DRAFT_191193 [Lophium mytilinum]|uniref:Uncharacterized protein n=1 Tax=Lophium mytilinum TaxID=390894 RepID=A0A6A6RCI1_9PEZI|nr:hypothetical protein BU16DRAFT_191193 [Lophium mytilinum]